MGNRKGGIITNEEEIKNQKNTVNNYMLINLSEMDNLLGKYKWPKLTQDHKSQTKETVQNIPCKR